MLRLPMDSGLNKHLLKWVAPSVITLCSGTALMLVLAAPALAIEQGRVLSGEHNASLNTVSARAELHIPVEGVPASYLFAQLSSGENSIVQVAPPRVTDYWLSITRQSGGTLVFDGFVPDETTRQAFGEIAGADTNFLKLGSGAPATYQSAADFGLRLLNLLAEGRFALNGDRFTITGIAANEADYRALRKALQSGTPQGLEVGAVDVQLPDGAVYEFAMSRAADDTVSLTGSLPDAALQDDISEVLGPRLVTEIELSPGAPEGFDTAARQAAAILSRLNTGEARFDGATWTITGQPSSAADLAVIETEYTLRNLADAGWTLNLSEPLPEPEGEPEAPVVAQPADPVGQPPVEPAAPTAQANPPSAADTPLPASPSNLAMCRERLAELSAHNAILFRSGAAIMAEGAEAELDLFAEALALCPQASVYVEGHTDSDGDDRQNLALSVARAEAVVAALIARDVPPERLYAVGYGESQPVADNDTAEGKRQNRRIVVSLDEPDAEGQ